METGNDFIGSSKRRKVFEMMKNKLDRGWIKRQDRKARDDINSWPKWMQREFGGKRGRMKTMKKET